jgi:hypothetical protein
MRWCPSCESERDLGEVFCEGCLEKGFEPWPISQEPIRPSGWRPATTPSDPSEPAQYVCPNGHPITAGDLICPECHVDIPALGDTIERGGFSEPDPPPYEPPPEIETPDTIDGWRLDRRLSTPGRVRERFVATRCDDDRSAVLTLYAHGHEPDPSVYAAAIAA